MRKILKTIAAVAILSIGLALSGCVIAGYVASIYGEPMVPAAYTPSKTPMLVLVKDAPDPSGMVVEADSLAIQIEQQITLYQVAPLADRGRVDELRRTNLAGFGSMSPIQLGRAAGADQVLLVQIQSVSVDSGAARDMLKGQITTTVAILDTTSGHQIWPTDGSRGMVISGSTPMLRASEKNTPLAVSQTLHAETADKIVKLFRKYKPDQ